MKNDVILEYKKEYNELLVREKKGEQYFEDQNIPQTEKDSHVETFKEILDRLNYLLSLIGRYTPQEIIEGFDIPVQETLFEGRREA